MRIAKSQYNHGYHFSRDKKEKIPDAETFFIQAIENTDGVPFQLIFGPQVGEGIYLNTGAGVTQLLGIAPGDFTETLYHEMIEEIIPLSDDIPADLIDSRRKFVNGEIMNYRVNVRVGLPCGTKKWILETSVPMIDDETGRIIGAIGVLYDDDSRKHILEKLVEARNMAEENERLKAAFLHNISHEIRTPLNAILGFSTLLEENPGSPEKRREYLDIISRSSDHLLEIIDDIVEISKIEAKTVKISRKQVNPNKVLHIVYDQYSSMASEKRVVFNFVVIPGGSDPCIYTDGYKVTQILRNLVSNALKFTNEGRVEFGYTVKENFIEFHISDTGIGIPAEQQTNIFTRFYQGDSTPTRSYGGTGLGLAISKAYVDLLGGDIWFTSHPGEGSVFRFTLPSGNGVR
jgi:signal transduction histidine kinase